MFFLIGQGIEGISGVMPSEKPVITFLVDSELLKRINDFRFDNRIETKSEAIRLLIEKGLESFEGKTDKR